MPMITSYTDVDTNQ